MEGQAQEEARGVVTTPLVVCVTGGRARLSDEREQMVWDSLDSVSSDYLRRGQTFILSHGGALGVDNAAMHWARERGVFSARWDAPWAIGRKAGPLRNQLMMVMMRPDILLSFPGGRGTDHCTETAHDVGVPIIFPYPDGWPA